MFPLNSQSSVELIAQIIVLSFTSLTWSLCSASEVSLRCPPGQCLYGYFRPWASPLNPERDGLQPAICSGPQNSLFPSKRLIPLNLHSVYFGVLHFIPVCYLFRKMDLPGQRNGETAETSRRGAAAGPGQIPPLQGALDPEAPGSLKTPTDSSFSKEMLRSWRNGFRRSFRLPRMRITKTQPTCRCVWRWRPQMSATRICTKIGTEL